MPGFAAKEICSGQRLKAGKSIVCLKFECWFYIHLVGYRDFIGLIVDDGWWFYHAWSPRKWGGNRTRHDFFTVRFLRLELALQAQPEQKVDQESMNFVMFDGRVRGMISKWVQGDWNFASPYFGDSGSQWFAYGILWPFVRILKTTESLKRFEANVWTSTCVVAITSRSLSLLHKGQKAVYSPLCLDDPRCLKHRVSMCCSPQVQYMSLGNSWKLLKPQIRNSLFHS